MNGPTVYNAGAKALMDGKEPIFRFIDCGHTYHIYADGRVAAFWSGRQMEISGGTVNSIKPLIDFFVSKREILEESVRQLALSVDALDSRAAEAESEVRRLNEGLEHPTFGPLTVSYPDPDPVDIHHFMDQLIELTKGPAT